MGKEVKDDQQGILFTDGNFKASWGKCLDTSV